MPSFLESSRPLAWSHCFASDHPQISRTTSPHPPRQILTRTTQSVKPQTLNNKKQTIARLHESRGGGAGDGGLPTPPLLPGHPPLSPTPPLKPEPHTLNPKPLILNPNPPPLTGRTTRPPRARRQPRIERTRYLLPKTLIPSKLGTYNTGKAIIWPWLQIVQVKGLTTFQVVPSSLASAP